MFLDGLVGFFNGLRRSASYPHSLGLIIAAQRDGLVATPARLSVVAIHLFNLCAKQIISKK
jgi:hypothetical protein